MRTGLSGRSAYQLALDLPVRSLVGREDFFVTSANEAAVRLVDAWPQWTSPVQVVVGPAGAGKSHLANIWQTKVEASVLDAALLGEDDVPGLVSAGAVLIEDAPGEALNETAMFHLINMVREHGATMLVTSRQFPAHWNVGLPDLDSRLRAAGVVEIEAADDVLLRAVLVKLFADRQIAADEAVISYMLNRMERSLDAARSLVSRVDRQALAENARITRPFVAKIMTEARE